MDPTLGGRDVHHAQSVVQGRVDDLRLAHRIELLDGYDQAFGIEVHQDLGSAVGRENGHPVDALPLLAWIVVEKGHHLEGVRAGPFDGLFGDDARLACTKDDHRCRSGGLKTLINGPHRDAKSDEEYRRSQQLNRHDTQRNRVGHVHRGGGQVLAQKQHAAHAQCEENPPGIPRTAKPDDARIGPENQHRQGPNQDVSGDEAPSRLQFMCRRRKFEPDRKGQPQGHHTQ